MEWSNILRMETYGQRQRPWSLISKNENEVCFHNADSTAFWYPPQTFYYRSTCRSACKTTHRRLLPQAAVMLWWDVKLFIYGDPRETPDVPFSLILVWCEENQVYLNTRKEKIVRGSALRILISLNDAPWSRWDYHQNGQSSQPFLKFDSQSDYKATQKKRNHLQSLIPSEKVWLSSFTFPAEIIWGSVVHKMLWNPWISITRSTISKHSDKKIEV